MRDLFGGIEHAHGIIVETGGLLRAAAGHGRYLGERRVRLAQRGRRIATSGLDEARRHALLIFEQGFQEMLRPYPLMAHANGNGLRALQKTLGAVRKFFEVHALFPKCRWRLCAQSHHAYSECSAAFLRHKCGAHCTQMGRR